MLVYARSRSTAIPAARAVRLVLSYIATEGLLIFAIASRNQTICIQTNARLATNPYINV